MIELWKLRLFNPVLEFYVHAAYLLLDFWIFSVEIP